MTKTKPTLFNVYGQFKVWSRNLADGTAEFQVRQGNRILSRHRWLFDAQQDASTRLDDHWDDLAQTARDLGIIR